jgi:two-component system, cell cycle response regulator
MLSGDVAKYPIHKTFGRNNCNSSPLSRAMLGLPVTISNPKSILSTPDGGRTLQIDRKDLGRGPVSIQQHCMLICVQGHEVGKPTELVLAETIVGRAPNCGLVLADAKVSRQHARVLWLDGGHVIEDLKSANGTFVGGVRIRRQPLVRGDVVQFGSAFAFRYSVIDSTQKALMEQLYRSSVLDALTGAYNREYFNSVLASELQPSPQAPVELCLLMLDIDHFKKINDTYGHQAGDAVLIELVNRLQARLRPSDVLCRYGGEEFAVILRSTSLADATKMAERLRQAARKQKMVSPSLSIPVTISIGCASVRCCAAPTPQALVAITDRRLYAAKHAGRDRVVDSG